MWLSPHLRWVLGTRNWEERQLDHSVVHNAELGLVSEGPAADNRLWCFFKWFLHLENGKQGR